MMPILAFAAMFTVAAVTLFAASPPAEVGKGNLMETPPTALADAKLPALPPFICGTERQAVTWERPTNGPTNMATRCPR